MDIWLWILILFWVPFGIGMYLLYRNGFAVTEMVAAVVIIFWPGKTRDRVRTVSCNGWLRHRGRFRESGIYRFTLDDQLTKGEAEVLLLDRDKRELLRLNRYLPTGETELNGKDKYYLRWEFRSATGSCELHW